MTDLMTALEEMQTQTLTIQASGIHATAVKWLLLEASTDFAAKAELPGRGESWERTQAARKQAEWHAKGQGVTLRGLLRSHGLLATADRLAPADSEVAETDAKAITATPDRRAQVSDEMAMIASSDDRIFGEEYCQTIQAALSLYDAAILRGDGCDEGTKWTEITPDKVAVAFLSRVMGVPEVA